MTASNGVSAEVIARIGELVDRTSQIADPAARETAVDLLQAVMALHAGALGRILEIVAASAGPAVIEALAADELLSSVLVLHGLHPDDMETRLRRALDRLRRYFDVRGGEISLVSLEEGRVHLRVHSARPGAGAAARQVIEDTIYEAAPDLDSLVIEGLEERRESGFVPLADLLAAQKA